ncbi:protein rough sheath 2 homolog [Mangifera indica]|uniref:protein rough sheath 2 homolog n=1 Tax=Mangifera indica TaxID=29780 RepID=UPI001CF952E4|nr:protein rough sheath 2 homolog [Mangifera indica]
MGLVLTHKLDRLNRSQLCPAQRIDVSMQIHKDPKAPPGNDNDEMERQRWQPEEDAILRAYVKQYGPKEWNLISQRMPKPLNRDPKSCLKRCKNYLKPGIRKGSLTPEEQSLVISLQAKCGNKWKKIAGEVPGRTAKRLGKWWEVFKEKQWEQLQKQRRDYSDEEGNNVVRVTSASVSSPEKVAQGRYDHILETFAEKYVQPKLSLPDPEPILSLGSGPSSASRNVLPLWMNSHSTCSSLSSSASSTTTASPSVSLSLFPSEPPTLDPVDMTWFIPGQQMGTLIQWCKEVKEGEQSRLQHKKDAKWRLSRLEQQLESEKARKRREKTEEAEAKIRSLREEEMAFLGKLESEYREQSTSLQRDAESKEAKLMKAWCNKHVKLVTLIEQFGVHSCHGNGFCIPN